MTVLRRAGRTRGLTLLLAAAAAFATLVVAVTPGIHFAYRSAAGHAAIETAAALIGFLAAYLMLARFRLERVVPDLWLASALAVLALTNLSFAVVPAIAAVAPGPLLSWARVFSELLGFLLFAYAAWAPLKIMSDAERLEHRALALVLGIPALGFVLSLTLASVLPAPVDPALSPESSVRPEIAGAALVEVAQVVAVFAFLLASIGFARRSDRDRDDFFRWMSTAALFAVLARVHYFLYPSLFSPWVHTGDFLRFAYVLTVLIASVREIASYQPRLARFAILDERRRIARDLHDGLAQELAYISSGLKSAEDEPLTEDEVARLIEAADQALLESRHAIKALSADPDEPLGVAVGRIASVLALRSGAEVVLDIEDGIDARPVVRDAVLRITREALTNAVRHGRAREVSVQLTANGVVALKIHDDGVGFVVAKASSYGGVGLQSMRERAHALGGELSVQSQPGWGTTVDALLPI